MFKYFISYEYTAYENNRFERFPNHTYLTLDHKITEEDIETLLDQLFTKHEEDCEPICIFEVAT